MNDSIEPTWLEGLNPAQREAASFGDGPLLIVAGAGTGKTKTLACRVAHLISSGVSPERILLLTFTRRAAEEMLKRAGGLIGRDSGGRVWGGTFHAVANRLLRMYAPVVGLLPEFTIMDESDAADLMNLIRSELGFDKSEKRFARKETLVKIYSHTVNAQKPLNETLKTHFPWHADDAEAIGRIFTAYTDRKKSQHLLDYDDLLLFWSALCASDVGPALRRRFEHILVDEYQDTNAVQAEILRGMRTDCDNITAVGDDAQAIYSFRAATIKNILDFSEHFPGPRIINLEQNYRSTQPILKAANAVMADATQRYTKELWSTRESGIKPALFTCIDEAEQTEAVCRHILEHLEMGVPLMRQAVLFRAGHHSAALEIELTKRNIPYHKYGGLKFLEAAHIKDMVALLRILENPYDEVSWFRVLMWFEKIGPSTARRLIIQLGVRRDANVGKSTLRSEDQSGSNRIEPQSSVTRLLQNPPSVPEAAAKEFQGLRSAFAFCRGMILGGLGGEESERREDATAKPPRRKSATHSGPVGIEPSLIDQLERLIAFYDPICRRRYDNAVVRLRDLDQLVSIASRYRSRSRFITDLTLDPPQSTSDLAQPPFLEEDYLILSTIHSAKGCEWDVVHVLHAADGMIPSDMALGDSEGVDEERRLFYVAMTRAKDMLYVYFPLRYYHRRFGTSDSHGFAQLTRFLPPPARSLFEQRLGQAELVEHKTATKFLPDSRSPHVRVNRLWSE